MAKHILVPLDQSEVAEEVVPVVADAARGGGAVVRLLHVAPVPENRVGEDGRIVAYADQEATRAEAEAVDYLLAVEARLAGIPVERAVRFGDPAEEIVREAEVFEADLIAMTTTRRSTIVRALLGSVAEHVFRKSPVPVLMLGVRRLAA